MESSKDQYREIIEDFARNRVDARISNGMRQHASALLETMFQSATAEMRIYTGSFGKDFYGAQKMVESACNFLRKPFAKLLILVQTPISRAEVEAHPLVKAIRAMPEAHGELTIWQAVGSYATTDADHFAVMDNDGFRFELNHDGCKAVANFNEPKTAQKLVDAFDKAVAFSRQAAKEVTHVPSACV